MKEAPFRLLAAFACAICAWTGEPVENTLMLGRKALANEGVATAWKLSQEALAGAPESAAVHEFAGEVLFRRGDFTHAEIEFKQSAKLDPAFARAWWGLARIAACTSMDKTADQYFRRAHDLDPRDPQLFLAWANRLKGAEHIDALETYVSMADPNREQKELDAIRQHIRLDKSLRGRKIAALAGAYEKS
jgi:Tfp pilus assembly protein PilF